MTLNLPLLASMGNTRFWEVFAIIFLILGFCMGTKSTYSPVCASVDRSGKVNLCLVTYIAVLLSKRRCQNTWWAVDNDRKQSK